MLNLLLHPCFFPRIPGCGDRRCRGGKVLVSGGVHHRVRLHHRALPHRRQVSLPSLSPPSGPPWFPYSWRSLCRQNGAGLNAMCARVGGILAPLIGLLDVYHHAIPMLIYGSLPFLGGALCFLLPETLNTELVDHTDDLDRNT